MRHIDRVVHFYGAHSPSRIIVTERMAQTLSHIIAQNISLSEEQMRKIALDVAIAIFWIHNCQKMYKDLSSKNILVTETFIFFKNQGVRGQNVSEVDRLWELQHYGIWSEYCGVSFTIVQYLYISRTPGYVAPEIWSGKYPCSYQVDVFAYGSSS